MISLRGVAKTYESPAGVYRALSGVDLEIGAGQFVAVVGKSGSGKSTLLNVIGGIDRPSQGTVAVAGTALESLGETPLSVWRGRTVGFVFQFFQLLPALTALENVMLPMDFAGSVAVRARRPRARALLEQVGVGAQADKLPATLSGGEQQRVAIARALANDPSVVLADEPTGNLDAATARDVIGLLRALAVAGKTILVVTHDADVAGLADRTVEISGGRLVCDSRPASRPLEVRA